MDPTTRYVVTIRVVKVVEQTFSVTHWPLLQRVTGMQCVMVSGSLWVSPLILTSITAVAPCLEASSRRRRKMVSTLLTCVRNEMIPSSLNAPSGLVER